jgi:predicted NUDIX family phosphoesterase
MLQKIAINRTVRDLKMFGLINEEGTEDVKFHLNLLWIVAWEQRGRELTAHNKRKIIQYNKENKEIERYNSIDEAAKILKYNRDVIDDSISERTKFTKKGYYFKYANPTS